MFMCQRERKVNEEDREGDIEKKRRHKRIIFLIITILPFYKMRNECGLVVVSMFLSSLVKQTLFFLVFGYTLFKINKEESSSEIK